MLMAQADKFRSPCTAAAGGERRPRHGARDGTTGKRVVSASMKPALWFGGDYNAFVLVVVPPRGPAQNPRRMASFHVLENKRKVREEESEAERRDPARGRRCGGNVELLG